MSDQNPVAWGIANENGRVCTCAISKRTVEQEAASWNAREPRTPILPGSEYRVIPLYHAPPVAMGAEAFHKAALALGEARNYIATIGADVTPFMAQRVDDATEKFDAAYAAMVGGS